jgi:hypothetical protein
MQLNIHEKVSNMYYNSGMSFIMHTLKRLRKLPNIYTCATFANMPENLLETFL